MTVELIKASFPPLSGIVFDWIISEMAVLAEERIFLAAESRASILFSVVLVLFEGLLDEVTEEIAHKMSEAAAAAAAKLEEEEE